MKKICWHGGVLAFADPCKPNPCKKDGICNVALTLATSYKCECPTGWSGIRCDIEGRKRDITEHKHTINIIHSCIQI